MCVCVCVFCSLLRNRTPLSDVVLYTIPSLFFFSILFSLALSLSQCYCISSRRVLFFFFLIWWFLLLSLSLSHSLIFFQLNTYKRLQNSWLVIIMFVMVFYLPRRYHILGYTSLFSSLISMVAFATEDERRKQKRERESEQVKEERTL